MKKMNSLAVVFGLMMALTSLSAQAAETKAEEIQSIQEVESATAICYAYDMYGTPYHWMHPIARIAAVRVMDVCFRASGAPCSPGGCEF